MRIVDCTLSASAYPILKKVLETVLESTEQAMFKFRPSGPYPLSIHAVDSLWVCQSVINLYQYGFDKHQIRKPVRVRVNVKAVHDFVRSCKQSRRIRMSLEATINSVAVNDGWYEPNHDSEAQYKLHFYDASNPKRCLIMADRIDTTPYPDIPRSEHVLWPNFSMTSCEFSNVTLDLAVGGMEMNVTMHPNCDIRMACDFDTGSIEHYGHHHLDNEVFVVHKAPCKTCTSGNYIVKFIKIICSMTMLSKFVTVFIQEYGSMVLELSDSRFVNYTFRIKPYTGPRDVLISENYRSYSLRVS
jgi:hypothetical protein